MSGFETLAQVNREIASPKLENLKRAGLVIFLYSLSFTALTGRLAGLDGTSAIAGQGAEQVNGYSATKYAIDTARANASDQQTLKSLFGKDSFDKGTVWMGPDACAVKVILDEGWPIDNRLEKRHYEIARIKK